jgi:hypothetical protein
MESGMNISTELLIAIISTAIALGSVTFAWQAAVTAKKTYGVELIGQLYAAYRSEEMLRDLRIVWKVYRKLWKDELGNSTKDELDAKVNNGEPIPMAVAIEHFSDLAPETREYVAIHNVINFWTYITLLMNRKVITVKETTAFTSPRILGILYPMEKAYQVRFESVADKNSKYKQSEKNIVLFGTYKVIRASKYW